MVISAPFLPREAERLAALHQLDVHDGLADASLAPLARLAARVCDAPLAMINLVDARRQWSLATVGLDDHREVPRAHSFCAHALARDEVLVVEDAARDPRFRDNPFVVGGPRVRFYAGAPLIDRDGHALGAVCALDRAPRSLSDASREGLAEVAAATRRVLDARRAEVAVRARAKSLVDEVSLLHTAIESLPNSAVYVFDHQLRVERVFGAATLSAASMSRSRYEGRLLSEWALPENLDRLSAAARACLVGRPSYTEVARHGRRFEVTFVPQRDAAGEVVRGLALAYDVTERDGLRERITRQERLVTTGTLAAGVGHEINNPLTFVAANLELALETLHARADVGAGWARDVASALSDARVGAERIRKIVRGLRAFAREGGPDVPTDVHAVVEISLQMAMHELRQRATPVVDLAPTPPVAGDEARLSQVFVNLLVNAAQSFPDHDPSRNRVVVRARVEAARVVVTVSDNGPGIAPDVLPHVFDPFFTTKPVGQGTGLGLAICHSVVTALGGEITCETRLGEGTTFRVSLPTTRDSPAPEAPRAPSPEPGRRGKVMVVDDEEAVLRSIARLLQSEHDVVALSDPREALARIESGERYDVVFCDLMMPRMNGVELFVAVRARSEPQAERFVFITGGVQDESVRAFLDEAPNERLEKPFSNQSLRGVARRLVSRPRGS